MIDFFKAIFKHAPSEGLVRWGPLIPDMFITQEELYTEVSPTGEDIFFGPAVRSTPNATKPFVMGGSTAWLDYDADPTATPISVLPPSITVASGGDGKYHFYWLLDRFVSAEDLERVNKGISAHQGDRKGTWDATRLLRVPGSLNKKYTPARRVDLQEFVPDRIYNPEDLAHLQAYSIKLLRVPSNKSRSERDFGLAFELVKWGISDAGIIQALMHISTKAREDGMGYITQTLEAAHESAQRRRGRKPSREPHELASFIVTAEGEMYNALGDEEGLALRITWARGNGVGCATQQNFDNHRAVNDWIHKNVSKTQMWRGTDSEARELWFNLIKEKHDNRILLVQQAGKHVTPDGIRIFVYGTEEAFLFPEDAKIPLLWKPPREVHLNLKFNQTPLETQQLERLARATANVNRPEVIYPALGWMMATPFKPDLEKIRGTRFPILLTFGQKGSGKTTMIRDVLLPLVGVVSPPLSSDGTLFPLLAGLSSRNAIPLWLGEFRVSNSNVEEMQANLRRAYDIGRSERGRPDQTITEYDLTAPVIVDGETMLPDAALKERTLPVRLDQKDIKEGMSYCSILDAVRIMASMQASFASMYIRWTLSIDPSQLDEWLTEGIERFKSVQYTRLTNNVSVAWVGMRAFDSFLKDNGVDIHLDFEAVYEALYKTLLNIYIPGLGVVTPVERFVELLSHHVRDGRSWASDHYDAQTGILWFNLTSAHAYIRNWNHDIPEQSMLQLQINDRVGTYIVAPIMTPNGILYGLDIDKARAFGLDVAKPFTAVEFSNMLQGDE